MIVSDTHTNSVLPLIVYLSPYSDNKSTSVTKMVFENHHTPCQSDETKEQIDKSENKWTVSEANNSILSTQNLEPFRHKTTFPNFRLIFRVEKRDRDR